MATQGKVIVGIELLTTKTCVAIQQQTSDGTSINLDAIKNYTGERTTSSSVESTNGEAFIFKLSKDQLPLNSQLLFYAAKHLIVKKANDPIVQIVSRSVPFEIVGDDNGNARIKIQDGNESKLYSPEQIFGIALNDIKEIIKNKTGKLPDHCIITVPAYFDDLQRQAVTHAAEIAQLPLLRLVSEPTAAVKTYQHFCHFNEGTVLIYDLRAANLDVSIVRVNNDKCVVQAVSGDTALGGVDFDIPIVEEMVRRFSQKNPGKDPTTNRDSMKTLKHKVEEAKIQLSSSDEAKIVIPNIVEDLTLDETLTRNQFEFLCDEIFSKLT